jgi:uncharacterized membrane protein YoaK (UPF0700 family)
MSSPQSIFLKTQQSLATVLSMVAGFIDAYGFINYKTYVSFMSGNITQMGSAVGEGNILVAIPYLVAIIFFVTGVFIGTLFTYTSTHKSQRLLLVIVATILLMIMTLTKVATLMSLPGIAFLSLAMGLMSNAISKINSEVVTIGYLTGTLQKMAKHLAMAFKREPMKLPDGPWDTHNRRALLLLGKCSAFFTGAMLSAAATVGCGALALLFPVLILLVLAM